MATNRRKRGKLTLAKFIKELGELPKKGWKVRKDDKGKIRLSPPKKLWTATGIIGPDSSYCDCPITAVNRQRIFADDDSNITKSGKAVTCNEYERASKKLGLAKGLDLAIVSGADDLMRILNIRYSPNYASFCMRFRVLALRCLALPMDRGTCRSELPKSIQKLLKVKAV